MQPQPADPVSELVRDRVNLQTFRDQAYHLAQELCEKYDLRMRLAGAPFPELGDDFVEEVLRALQRLRIDPFTKEVG